MSKLLTVAIPTYNGGDNLIRAIKSCKNINLSHDEYEILVVDNCSTDGSIRKVEELRKVYPNIRILRNERNLGRIGNWNRCLELAEGKYLIFLFSNDELLKFDYKSALKILENNDDVALIYNRVEYNFGNCNKRLTPKLYKDCEMVDYYRFVEDYFLKKKDFTSFGICQQHIFSMNIIRRYNIKFNEKIPRTADRVFIAQNVLFSNKKIYFLNEIQTRWNLSKSRFHFKVHVEMNNIDIYENFKTNWIEEIEANRYIMENASISPRTIFEKHYEKYYLLSIISTLKKFLSLKENRHEYMTLKLFLVYLELNCKIFHSNITLLKFKVYCEIISKIIRKFFKSK